MGQIKNFVKREPVLSCAVILAVLSAFWVRPDRAYIDYIDFRTLAILFCLMCVMAGLQELGMFGWIARKLLGRIHRASRLVCLLVLLCFFFSMLITNDVALITFVPFTFTVGQLLGEKTYRRMIFPVTALQTVAANLGSMLTPVGNPQNLYLYGISGMGAGEFMGVMFPYSLLSLLLLAVCCIGFGTRIEKAEPDAGKQITAGGDTEAAAFAQTPREKLSLAVCLILFLCCLLTVARIVPLWVSFAAVCAGICVVNRRVFAKVDYGLLLTFVAFFVFIGNMGRLPAFSGFLQRIVSGNEVWAGILASQCISNVPAALLLSGFTDNVKGLLVGVNLGGLGTLIASMASLISYKYIAAENAKTHIPGGTGRYILYFTIMNLFFLAALTILYVAGGRWI